MSHTAIILTPLQEVIGLLESDDFYCEVAVSSSMQGFYRRLTSQPTTLQLAELVRANPENAHLVLEYADRLARSISGKVRSEKDVALCACVVALGQAAGPRVDDFLRYLRTTKELALRWASEVAEFVSRMRIGTVQIDFCWSTVSTGTIVSGDAGETREPSELPRLGFRPLSTVV